jgi:hypothetical protein
MRRITVRPIATFVLLTLLAACAAPEAPAPTTVPSPAPPTPDALVRIVGISASAPSVGRYEKFELTLDIAARYQNPFDPAQIDVQGIFSGPDGQVANVPGFYWQDYISTLADGKEQLAPNGKPAWKVRFTPPSPGRWSYVARVVTPDGWAESAPTALEVTPSDRHGFIRVDRRDPAYFAFDDGTPYVAIGENVGWYGAGGTHDYERWFGKLGANGANFARIWMPSWAQGIEWSDTGLGDYTKRLDRAWQLDRIFALAEQNQISIMLCLLNHGAFNTTVNPEWDQNPYNAALGGPLAKPEEFATNPRARELFKRRLRYIVARWGYSTNLLAWEWWNEVEWTRLGNRELLMPWIKEMSAQLKTLDPYNHLRTISYAHGGDDQVWAMPEIDIVQRHIYDPRDPPQSFPLGMREMLPTKKPALYSEFGTGADGADSTDRDGVHVHNGIWAGVMTKGSGGGMTWWWDNYIDPLNLYGLFAGPAAFLKGEDLAAGFRPRSPKVENGDAAALTLNAPQRVLGWVKSKSYSYEGMQVQRNKELLQALKEKRQPKEITPTFPAISGATVTISGLAPGAYKVEWWDTHGQGVLQSDPLTAGGDTIKLPVPAFDRDLAFKVIQQNR